MIKIKNPFKVLTEYFSIENRIKRSFSDKKYKGLTVVCSQNTINGYEYAVLVDPNIYTHEISMRLFDVSITIYNKNDYISKSKTQNFYLSLYRMQSAHIGTAKYFNSNYNLRELKAVIDRFVNRIDKNKISIELGK